MRRATMLLLLSLFILPMACAKEPAPKPERALEASATDLDFQTISTAQKSTIVFVVKSTGSTPVTITDFKLESDDPDFTMSVPITPFVLKAGSTTNIGVVFDPTGAGQGTATLTISTNSKTTPKITVKIKAYAYDPTLDIAKSNGFMDIKSYCAVLGLGL